jgi:hypothetical protein
VLSAPLRTAPLAHFCCPGSYAAASADVAWTLIGSTTDPATAAGMTTAARSADATRTKNLYVREDHALTELAELQTDLDRGGSTPEGELNPNYMITMAADLRLS